MVRFNSCKDGQRYFNRFYLAKPCKKQGRRLENISFADVGGRLQRHASVSSDTSINQAVKYRTIIGNNSGGSIAVFPAPHQYFYPLDEAFNLKFVWRGAGYCNMVKD
jgi:hypothetical protein